MSTLTTQLKESLAPKYGQDYSKKQVHLIHAYYNGEVEFNDYSEGPPGILISYQDTTYKIEVSEDEIVMWLRHHDHPDNDERGLNGKLLKDGVYAYALYRVHRMKLIQE